MSRLGKNPIKIPEGVTVSLEDGVLLIKGSKGELSYSHRPEISVIVEGDAVVTAIKENTKEANAYWGLTVALIKNMLYGVSEGYEKRLELVGVGYRVKQVNDSSVALSLGYSHPIDYTAPQGINLKVDGTKEIIVTGIDKQLVGLTAAKIREFRKPEPYKGKGVKYVDEAIRRKPGKAGKV